MYSTSRRYLVLCLILVSSVIGDNAFAQTTVKPAYSVTGEVTAGDNQLGVTPGERIYLDFMLDPGMTPTLSISTNERLVFVDPWRWHWRLWDWLRGFIVWLPRFPIPGPDPAVLQIQAVFDDSQDMVMTMPGVPPLARGSSFLTNLEFPGESAFVREGRLPSLDELNTGFMKGSFRVLDPQGKVLLDGKVDAVKGTPSAPPCKSNSDGDGDVDASDVRVLREEFGRRDCPLM